MTFGNMVFIAGIGAHFKGDIKAHTKHVLDEIEKRLLSVGSSMEQGAEGERVPERPERLRRHERGVSRTVRRRTAGEDDDRGRWQAYQETPSWRSTVSRLSEVGGWWFGWRLVESRVTFQE